MNFTLVAISVGRNIKLTRKIITEFNPSFVSVQDKETYETLKAEFPSTTFTYGEEGLTEVAVYDKADVLVNAVMGSVGLYPTLQAIEAKKTIAIANKETLGYSRSFGY